MTATYYKRFSEANISDALADTPVVYITGPRQCGKTTLVKSLIDDRWEYINLDDQAQLSIAKMDPGGFIRNLSMQHTVIDEVQRLPELLLAIKQSVDENRIPGRFLLTGSSNVLVLPQVCDSLAGRIETIFLSPLSECEIKHVKPTFLTNLVSGQSFSSKETRIRDDLIKRIVTGCFPEPLKRDAEKRIKAWYKQYLNALIQKDMKEIEHIDHPEKMLQLLKLAAYFSGKLVNYVELGDKLGLGNVTTKKYMQLLEQLFLLKNLPAWHHNEYKRLVKTPKMHLSDTGLLCAIRNITQEQLINDPRELGILVESFVINELQKQALWFDEDLEFYHYRDKDKEEVDCIIEDSQGGCYAIEIKAKVSLNSKDFSGLRKFKQVAEKRFKVGVLLYDGDHINVIDDNIIVAPLGVLWV